MSAVFLFLFHFFFKSDPPIVVARETTYIAQPLSSDGLPDYEQYMLDTYRKGTTHNNNAAVLMWQALWPGDLDQPDYEPMRAELGLKELPRSSSTLQLPFGKENERRVEAWWKKQHPNSKDIDTLDIMDLATKSAWTSREFPPMAEWVRANKKPLDLIVEASRRPRFYSPSPSLLRKYKGLLITMLLPGTQNMRAVADALSIRAMQHIGENHLDEAWVDLMANHRLASLTAQTPTRIEQSIAMAISHIANQGTLALLSNDHLTAELARHVDKDLASLSNFSKAFDCINNAERLEALDIALDVKRHGADAIIERPRLGPDVTKIMSFDWNVTFRRINYWYDRLVAAMQLPNREARKRAYTKFKADLSADGQRSDRPMEVILAAFSIHRRSKMMGGYIAAQMLSAIDDPMEFEERTNTSLNLMRIAAALAIFRAEHHAYPAKLGELVPALLEKSPVDIYNAKPFLYERLGKGYMLYSAGENGTDDGGSCQDCGLFEGQSLIELKNFDPKKRPPQIPAGADDISIRVPCPPFALPNDKLSGSAF